MRNRKPFAQQNQDQNTNWLQSLETWLERRRKEQPSLLSSLRVEIVKCGLNVPKHTFFSRRVSVVRSWVGRLNPQRQWSRWSSKDEVQQWDTCPEPTSGEHCASWVVVRCERINVDPGKIFSKSNMLTPRTGRPHQPRKKIHGKIDDLTCWFYSFQTNSSRKEGNFTSDEGRSPTWDMFSESHDWSFDNIMNFSNMFSCSHFSNFLSDPIRKQQCHVKERTRRYFQWRFPMAKPKPMNPAMAKSRPMNLVLHNPLSARKKEPSARFERSRQVRRMPKKNEAVLQIASGTWCGTHAKIQSCILKWGDRKTLKMQIPWKPEDRDESSSSICAPVNWYGRWTQRRSSQNMNDLKFSILDEGFPRFAERSWESQRTGYATYAIEAMKDQCTRYGGRSCLRQWKQPFILDQIVT